MVHVGIDIGTSNTVVAITNPGGVEVRPIDGETLVPSVIHVHETGGLPTVGHAALAEWANPDFDQACSFRRWKLDIGDKRQLREMRFGGTGANATDITPELLTTWLVEHVLTELSKGVGGVDVESVLVTVPHGWRRDSPRKCRATRLAAGAAKVADQPVQVQELTVSEPVAAAVYWLWEARKAGGSTAAGFSGQTLLVIDVGGGTFDLSLVRVGATQQEPLVVIDAANNTRAGDYATALVLGRVLEQYNQKHAQHLPTDPEELLVRVGSLCDLWLRAWFLDCQGLAHRHSRAFAAGARRPGRVPTTPTTQVFTDAAGRDVTLRLTPTEYQELLEPFYASGRELLKRFLTSHGRTQLPYAVVFAGGGSRIAGVRDQIAARVLQELAPQDAEAILSRVPMMNDNAIDRAIAMGAALVANGVVSVEERLLCDIGIKSHVFPELARHLGLGDRDVEIVLTPALARGSRLPARFRSADQEGLPPLTLLAGEDLEVEVVVFDDQDAPWVQSFSRPHPADGQTAKLEIEMEADTDGVLGVTFRPVGRPEVTLEGRLARERPYHGTIAFTAGDIAGPEVIRVSVEQLAEALRKAREGAG